MKIKFKLCHGKLLNELVAWSRESQVSPSNLAECLLVRELMARMERGRQEFHIPGCDGTFVHLSRRRT